MFTVEPISNYIFLFLFLFFFCLRFNFFENENRTNRGLPENSHGEKKEILYLFLYTCLPLKTLSLSLFLSLSVCLSIFFCLLFQAANRLLQRQYCIVPKIKTVNDVCFFGRKEKKYTCSKNYHSLAFWQWFLPLLFWLIF
jgi:hypothetical protein